MCSSDCVIVLAIVAVIGGLYISAIYDDEEIIAFSDSDNFDDPCQQDTTVTDAIDTRVQVVVDPDTCDPNENSKISCCFFNPIIHGQMNKMKNKSNCNSCASSALHPCLPNIGSRYLGSAVVTTRETIRYKHPLGTPESEKTNKPSLVIRPSPVIVGKNWHFVGTGALVVSLFYPAHISGFAIQHVPRCQLPQGYETSTPKDFHVMGLNDVATKEPFLFGNYMYDINGTEVQLFPAQKCSPAKFKLIEFRFTSNYGNSNYTAIYKVRIHGDIGPPPFQSRHNESQSDNRNQTYGFNA